MFATIFKLPWIEAKLDTYLLSFLLINDIVSKAIISYLLPNWLGYVILQAKQCILIKMVLQGPVKRVGDCRIYIFVLQIGTL